MSDVLILNLPRIPGGTDTRDLGGGMEGQSVHRLYNGTVLVTVPLIRTGVDLEFVSCLNGIRYKT